MYMSSTIEPVALYASEELVRATSSRLEPHHRERESAVTQEYFDGENVGTPLSLFDEDLKAKATRVSEDMKIDRYVLAEAREDMEGRLYEPDKRDERHLRAQGTRPSEGSRCIESHLRVEEVGETHRMIMHRVGQDDEGWAAGATRQDNPPSRTVQIADRYETNLTLGGKGVSESLADVDHESELTRSTMTRARDIQRGTETNRPNSVCVDDTTQHLEPRNQPHLTRRSRAARVNDHQGVFDSQFGPDGIIGDPSPLAEWQTLIDVSDERRPVPTRLNDNLRAKSSEASDPSSNRERHHPDSEIGTRELPPMCQTRDTPSGRTETENYPEDLRIETTLPSIEVENKLSRTSPPVTGRKVCTEREARQIIEGRQIITEDWVRGGADTRSAYKVPAKSR
jgi:hypothetical protein